jgi:hypothetical protein
MKYKILQALVISAVAVVLSGSLTFSDPNPANSPMGLSVSPGGLQIQSVEPGKEYDLFAIAGVTLTIENKSDISQAFSLTVAKPSQIGNKKWLKGYLEIPDTSWFWFEKNEVTIDPQSTANVKMFFKIPDEEKYYNQRWSVSVGVTGKLSDTQNLALAVFPRYQIETLSKANLNPAGTVSVSPSVMNFDGAEKTKQEHVCSIYNNDTKSHTYKIKLIAVTPDDSGREIITNTPGYTWMTNIKFLRTSSKKVTLKPGQKKEITLQANLTKPIKGNDILSEALLFITPDTGPSVFVRVLAAAETDQVKK